MSVPGSSRKVFDCFTFFNELDLLEIRLNELDSVVDRFVLCEARFTFKGKPKPLYFDENRARFEKFLPRIEHVVIDTLPPGREVEHDYFLKEKFQRNALLRGVRGAAADDLVILTDVDEIPSADAIRRALAFPKPAVFVPEMAMSHFFLNFFQTAPWEKARIARFGDIRTLQALRSGGPSWKPKSKSPLAVLRQWKRMAFGVRHIRPWVRLPDAGWHFTSLSGPAAVAAKLAAYSHVRDTSAEAIARRIVEGLEGSPERIAGLDRTPDFVRANKARFAHLLADRGTAEALRQSFHLAA